jgi:hypothetical protein
MAKDSLRRDSRSQAPQLPNYDDIDRAFAIEVAFISEHNEDEIMFERKEQVMHEFIKHIERILRDTQPIQENTIDQILKKIHDNEMTDHTEIFIKLTGRK